jgi:hypothetical protein
LSAVETDVQLVRGGIRACPLRRKEEETLVSVSHALAGSKKQRRDCAGIWRDGMKELVVISQRLVRRCICHA